MTTTYTPETYYTPDQLARMGVVDRLILAGVKGADIYALANYVLHGSEAERVETELAKARQRVERAVERELAKAQHPSHQPAQDERMAFGCPDEPTPEWERELLGWEPEPVIDYDSIVLAPTCSGILDDVLAKDFPDDDAGGIDYTVDELLGEGADQSWYGTKHDPADFHPVREPFELTPEELGSLVIHHRDWYGAEGKYPSIDELYNESQGHYQDGGEYINWYDHRVTPELAVLNQPALLNLLGIKVVAT